MAGAMDLSIIVRLIDQMSAPLRAMQAQLDAFARGAEKLRNAGQHMQQMGAMAAATSAGAVAGLKGIAGAAIEFESTMADVKKVVDFESPAAFQQMSDDILEMSTRIPMAATGIGDITAAAGQAGIAQGELKRFAEDAAKVGVAFDISGKEAGSAMTGLRTIFRLNQDEARLLADSMNHLSNNMDAKARDILNIQNRVGSTANLYKVSGAQLGALGAAFLALKTPPEIASTGINALLVKLGDATGQNEKFKGALAEIGMTAEGLKKSFSQDAQGAIVSFLEKVKTAPDTVGLLNKLFGMEYGDDIAKLVSGLDEYKKAIKLVSDQTAYAGSVEKEYKTRSETTANALILMQNNLNRLAVTFGSIFLPMINEALVPLQGFATGVAAWVKANPDLARTLGIVAIAVTGFMAAIGAIGLIGGTIISGLGMIGGAIAALASPITLIIAAIASMGYLIYRNWDQVKAAFAPVMAAMGPLVGAFARLRAALFGAADGGAALERLGQVANRVFGFMINYLSTMWTFIAKWVTAWVNAIAGVIEVLSGGSGKISDVLRAIFRAFDQAFDGSLSKFLAAGRDLVRGLAQGLKEGGHVVLGEIADFAASIITKFTGLLGIKSPSRVFAGFGGDLMMGLLQGVKGMAGAVVDEIANVGKNLVTKFTGLLGIKSPSRVFAGFGGDLLAGLGLGIDAGTAAATERMAGAARGVAKAGAAALAMGAVGVASPALAAPMGLASPALAAQAGMAPGAAPGGGASGAITITINLTVNAGAGADGAAIGGAVKAAAPDMAQQLAAILRRQDRTRY